MIGKEELYDMMRRLPVPVLALDRQLRLAYANSAANMLFQPAALRLGRPLPEHELTNAFEGIAYDLFRGHAGPSTCTVASDHGPISVHGIPPFGGRLAAFVAEPERAPDRGERAKTDLVANAAHELLTPLTGIVSAAHVLEAGAKEVPEMRDRFLHHIARECNRLTRTARGLLVLARAQSGQEPPRPESIELGLLLDDVIEGTMDGHVDVQCADGLRVFVDRDLAETALSNLVANAVRHTTDGRVVIAAQVEDGREIGIAITNATPDGTAVDMTRFQGRFVRGEGRDGGGYGLGISIASDAVETLGGTLRFEHEDGKMRTLVALPRA